MGRLSTKDPHIKIGCYVKKKNIKLTVLKAADLN
jgi:hypothetical protein